MNRADQLMIILCEESAEVIQATTKALRFGPTEVYPETGQSNVDRLVDELNDMQAVIWMLQAEGVLPAKITDLNKIEAKRAKVEKYIAYSHSIGRCLGDCSVCGHPIAGKPPIEVPTDGKKFCGESCFKRYADGSCGCDGAMDDGCHRCTKESHPAVFNGGRLNLKSNNVPESCW